ncbi:putative transcription factor C2C2-YABBY family [Helianthus annuus]|nr:putative transcription factor C2C2-YABBY family [Helianthus annuus]KAJ0746635.1 putative transcription factor C2C2-YABBY family [Helianthus annuus]
MANTRNFCDNEVAVSDEQLCYIPCNFCNIVLAVNVPCSKLFDIVKVKCEYCNNMWPVNMGMVAGFHHPDQNHTSQDSSSRLDDQVFFFTFITLI